MEVKDIVVLGMIGLGAYFILKGGFQPKMISTGEGGFRIIPILPSYAEIGKAKEEETPQTTITYNIEIPKPEPISIPTPPPEPKPKKKVYYSGRTGTWTYEPETGHLYSPKGEGYSTAYPKKMIESIEKAPRIEPKPKPKPKKEETYCPIFPDLFGGIDFAKKYYNIGFY